MNTQQFLSPAKLNLFLHIVGRRDDGYHDLQTAFQLLDWGDEITFSLRDDNKIVINDFANIPLEQNIIYRASKLLQKTAGEKLGITITVNKQIPIGGGLGGGSSNAATTLIVLNRLWQLGYSQNELLKLGLQLGADVPIFIFGHSAWAEGVGEKLTALDLPETWYIVLDPQCPIATKEIFSAQELTRDTPAITIQQFFAGYKVHNDFEIVVRKRYPAIAAALDWLNQYAPSHLTGSGCCLFAKAENKNHAEMILKKCPVNLRGFIAKGCNKSPLINEDCERRRQQR